MRRISRPCYDKYHRCPGWSGGGIHSARVNRCPDGGYIPYPGDNGFVTFTQRPTWKWRFGTCPKCGVLVLPWMVRWIDPAYIWQWKIRKDFPRWLEYRIWEWKHRR